MKNIRFDFHCIGSRFKFASMDGFSIQDKYEKEDYYLSKEGYIVFTEKFHLKRGYCCKNGCKHCPYGFKKNKK